MKKTLLRNLMMNEWINLHSAASGALLNPGTLTQWEPWIIHVRFKILKQCETLIQGARAFFGTFSIFSHRDKHKNTWTQILKLRKNVNFYLVSDFDTSKAAEIVEHGTFVDALRKIFPTSEPTLNFYQFSYQLPFLSI